MEIRNEDGSLKAEFSKGGFFWRIERQTDNAVMVSKSLIAGGVVAAFELFPYLRTDQPAFVMGGRRVEAKKARQYFPNDEDFGKSAWTWKSRAEADMNFDALDKSELAKKREKEEKEKLLAKSA